MTTITAVRAVQVAGRGDTPANEERQVGMLDIHPRYAARPGAGTGGVRRIEAIYVEIDTDDGVTGRFGPIFAETAAIIQLKLAAHLDRGRPAGGRIPLGCALPQRPPRPHGQPDDGDQCARQRACGTCAANSGANPSIACSVGRRGSVYLHTPRCSVTHSNRSVSRSACGK